MKSKQANQPKPAKTNQKPTQILDSFSQKEPTAGHHQKDFAPLPSKNRLTASCSS